LRQLIRAGVELSSFVSAAPRHRAIQSPHDSVTLD